MGNLVLYPHMRNFAYGDRRMHMGIPVCKRARIAEKIAYGDLLRIFFEILIIYNRVLIIYNWFFF